LVDRASAFDADAVATGHYARVDRDEQGRYRLRRGVDGTKDQAYFLFSLTQDQLSRALFPVGGRSKADIRDYARHRGLPVANKPDSQEICFIPDHDYSAFVEKREPAAREDGRIVDQAGHVLGSHEGIHRFTVGQRKGLGLGGATAGQPVYVLALRPDSREVVVGPKCDLERTTFTASGVNWIIRQPSGPIRAAAQIRHRHHAAPASVSPLDNDRAEIVFDASQVAITPGQAVVFYDDDMVLGGGWIESDPSIG
jgi:tRNA-specific 2-thiouridylase